MAQYQHPGIYIEEIPSDRSIEGVPTDVTCFIGVAEKGPVNEPVLITGWDGYTRTFGGFIWNRYLAYAVYAYFTEGGGSCYVVRVGETGTPSAATVPVGNITFTATSPGKWGNDFSIAIVNDSVSPPTTSKGGAGSAPPSPTFAVQVVAEVKTKTGAGSKTPPMYEQTLKAYIAKNQLTPQKGNAQYVLESFSGFTVTDLQPGSDGGPSNFENQINGGSLFVTAKIAAAGGGESGAGGASPEPRPPNGVNALTGGTAVTYNFADAIDTLAPLREVSLVAMPDTVGSKTPQADINLLLLAAEKYKRFFVVIDPPYGLSTTAIMDFKQGGGSGTGGGQALNSEYGALYYPWLWFLNPTSGKQLPMPPSGMALGRYVYTDQAVGVWKAPAGTQDGSLQMATAINAEVTDQLQDYLNPAGINAIRSFVNYGIVIWGARTLSSDTEWTYINVRRLLIFIEQSLYEGLRWVVFEPNSPKLWATVTRDISAFLTNLWQEGALFGTSAAQAFFVVCNESNNPPETRMLGELIVDIGVAPVKPAEFVILRITQKTLPSGGSGG